LSIAEADGLHHDQLTFNRQALVGKQHTAEKCKGHDDHEQRWEKQRGEIEKSD